MTRFVDVKGNLFPEIGERLIHKAMGYVGRYRGEVMGNKGRKHFQVEVEIDGAKRQLILPAEDWIYAQADD